MFTVPEIIESSENWLASLSSALSIFIYSIKLNYSRPNTSTSLSEFQVKDYLSDR